MRLGIEAAQARRELIGRSSHLEVIRVSKRDFDEAVELMLSHSDKRWSFTDCTSFGVMRQLPITDAVTFDQNFREAGTNVFPGNQPVPTHPAPVVGTGRRARLPARLSPSPPDRAAKHTPRGSWSLGARIPASKPLGPEA